MSKRRERITCDEKRNTETQICPDLNNLTGDWY
jgi:hypothetical protein